MARSCGAYYVNSDGTGNAPVPGNANPVTNGTDDGVTIVGGHEYAEALTDAVPVQGTAAPSGGWYVDPSGNEIADLSAWGTGGHGGHRRGGPHPLDRTVRRPGALVERRRRVRELGLDRHRGQARTVRVQGPVVDLVPSASTTATSPTLTWAATGLPTGLTISSSTGEISGSTSVGTSTIWVTATDANGVADSRRSTLLVTGTAASSGT